MTRTSEATSPPAGETAPRILLRDVELTRRRRRIARVHAALIVVFATVGAVTYFLPNHEVYETEGGGIADIGCAFMPDCDPGFVEPTDTEPRTRRVVAVHSGYDHDGIAVVLLLALLVALAVANFERQRWRRALASALAALPWLVALFYAVFDLDHLFDNVAILPAGAIHGGAMLGVSALALAWLPLVLVLYLGARRAIRRAHASDAPELPAATVRRG